MKYLRTHIQRTLSHEGFKKYFKNTGWLFSGRIFSLGISFVIGLYIARYLGPAGYGELNYVISFVGLFGFLATLGIDSIAGRELIRDHARRDQIIGTSYFLKMTGALCAIFAIMLFSAASTRDFSVLVLIWLFSLSYIPQAFNILEIYFQSQVLSRKVVIVQMVATVIATLAKLACVFFGASLTWLVATYLLEATITAAGLLFAFRTYGHRLHSWRFDRSIAVSLLRDSWPMMLSGAAIGIYMKIDQVMINALLGDTSGGLYAAAAKLSELWNFIPMLLCTSLAPAIINAIDSQAFERRLRKLYVLMLFLSGAIALGVTLFASPVVLLLFGNEYAGAIPVLQIYVWACVSVFLGVAFGQFLLARNLTKISFYTTVFGAVSNVLLNIVLIPRFGMQGAAIATVVSYAVATFAILLFREPREHSIRVLKSIIWSR